MDSCLFNVSCNTGDKCISVFKVSVEIWLKGRERPSRGGPSACQEVSAPGGLCAAPGTHLVEQGGWWGLNAGLLVGQRQLFQEVHIGQRVLQCHLGRHPGLEHNTKHPVLCGRQGRAPDAPGQGSPARASPCSRAGLQGCHDAGTWVTSHGFTSWPPSHLGPLSLEGALVGGSDIPASRLHTRTPSTGSPTATAKMRVGVKVPQGGEQSTAPRLRGAAQTHVCHLQGTGLGTCLSRMLLRPNGTPGAALFRASYLRGYD